MKNWGSYEKAAERGPLQIGFISIFAVAIFTAAIWGIGTVFGWFGEAATVAQQQFGPAAAVQKYEWFKDAASQLDRKKADLTMFDARVDSLKKLSDSDRHADALNQAVSERIGVASSYNDLAARYNSSMAKANWRWANIGDVPAGSEALPREYREYVTGGTP
jgi:hypothetical protein